jgi:hypothetical protein
MSAALANSPVETHSTHLEVGHQLWECQVLGCGSVRVWGWLNPEDKKFKARLNCESCRKVTPHNFFGVAGRVAI